MIYAMDPDGGHVTLLSAGVTPGDAHPDWSPDGTRIAFTSRRTGGNQAWVMNADGSNPVRLTKNLAACQDPAWSPSGARIAVICKSSGTLQVWTVSPTGTGAQRVTADGKTDASPTWSPDGSRIAYTANTSGFAADLVGERERRCHHQPLGHDLEVHGAELVLRLSPRRHAGGERAPVR